MNKYLFLEIVNQAGYKSLKEFAKSLGISYSKLNNQVNGVTKVSTEDASKYCKKLGVYEDDRIVEIFFKQIVL